MSSFIVGPLSLEEMGPADSITCTVNGKRYEGLLRNKVISTLQLQSCLDRNAFMQERVSPHIAKSLMQLLKRNFKKNKIINRHFSTIWSLRSPDLSLWLLGVVDEYRHKVKIKRFTVLTLLFIFGHLVKNQIIVCFLYGFWFKYD